MMKRTDITPGGVYSLVSYRGSRQGWPVMILSKDSYQQHRRTKAVDYAGNDRLVQGDYRRNAVGLLVVKLAFNMHVSQGEEGEEPPMDVLDFRAKVEKVRELTSVQAAIKTLNASADKVWDDREHLTIRDAEGTVLGHYELLTGLQMIVGDYVTMTLAERAAAAEWKNKARAERERRVAERNGLADRLDRLGLTGYRLQEHESPGIVMTLKTEDLEILLTGAENFYADYPGDNPKMPKDSYYGQAYAEYLAAGAPGSWNEWLRARNP